MPDITRRHISQMTATELPTPLHMLCGKSILNMLILAFCCQVNAAVCQQTQHTELSFCRDERWTYQSGERAPNRSPDACVVHADISLVPLHYTESVGLSSSVRGNGNTSPPSACLPSCRPNECSGNNVACWNSGESRQPALRGFPISGL